MPHILPRSAVYLVSPTPFHPKSSNLQFIYFFYLFFFSFLFSCRFLLTTNNHKQPQTTDTDTQLNEPNPFVPQCKLRAQFTPKLVTHYHHVITHFTQQEQKLIKTPQLILFLSRHHHHY
jgi:hypothetical protein